LRRTDSQTGGEVKDTADLSLAVTTLILSAKYGDDRTVKAKRKVNLLLAYFGGWTTSRTSATVPTLAQHKLLTPSFFLTRTEAPRSELSN